MARWSGVPWSGLMLGLLAGGCSAGPHAAASAGSGGDLPRLQLPAPLHPRAGLSREDAETYPNPEAISRDPFLTEAEELPPALPVSKPETPVKGRQGTPSHSDRRAPVAIVKPPACTLDATVVGANGQRTFSCGGEVLSEGSLLAGVWRVDSIEESQVRVHDVRTGQAFSLQFHVQAWTPILERE